MPTVSENRGFASDNYAGCHPRVLAALAEANIGHAPAYGHDAWTTEAELALAKHCGDDARCFFVANGTAANVLGLKSVCRSFDAVVCADDAHINTDECGAPEAIGGLKLMAINCPSGKLTPALIDQRLTTRLDVHRVRPRVLSLSQSTEQGLVYTLDELAALRQAATRHQLLLHIDGARFANAAVALGVDLKTMIQASGVDILSLGGTKNGLLFGEAVVFLHAALAEDFGYLRKQSMQLFSKMRFVAAQFLALYGSDLWLANARQANAMARFLAEQVASLDGVRVTRPVYANAVFAILPAGVAERLMRQTAFYVWNEASGEVRWMTAFDTTPDDISAFVSAIKREIAR